MATLEKVVTTLEKPESEQSMQSFIAPSKKTAFISGDWEEHESKPSMQPIKAPSNKAVVAYQKSKIHDSMERVPRRLESSPSNRDGKTFDCDLRTKLLLFLGESELSNGDQDRMP
jgi:hypothetical protein